MVGCALQGRLASPHRYHEARQRRTGRGEATRREEERAESREQRGEKEARAAWPVEPPVSTGLHYYCSFRTHRQLRLYRQEAARCSEMIEAKAGLATRPSRDWHHFGMFKALPWKGKRKRIDRYTLHRARLHQIEGTLAMDNHCGSVHGCVRAWVGVGDLGGAVFSSESPLWLVSWPP
jgi:hypothetical protein